MVARIGVNLPAATAADVNDDIAIHDDTTDTYAKVPAMGVGIRGAAEAFADADATPSVASGQVAYTTANSSATTITDFDDGFEGQTILVVLDANTTIDCSANANIRGNAGVNITGAANDAVRATLVGTTWYLTLIDAA